MDKDKHSYKKPAKEKRGEGFEKLVAAIETALRRKYGEQVRHNVRILEFPGLYAAIDVLVEGHGRTIIECKDKSKPATLAEMRTLADVCRNNNARGVFVSKSGFQKGAKKKAQAEGIKMFTLTSLSDEELHSIFVPQVRDLILCHALVSARPVVGPKNAEVVSRNTDDDKIYIGQEKAALSRASFIEHMYVLNRELIFAPIIDDFMKGKVESGREYGFMHVFESEEELFVICSGNFIPLLGVQAEFRLWLSEGQVKETKMHRYSDANENTISDIISTEHELHGASHTIAFVDSKEMKEVNVFAIPNFRSSEIKELREIILPRQ